MRALLVSALSDDLSGCALAEIAQPTRRAGELLVRVRAASLNYPDLLMTRGQYQSKPSLPFVPGMEMAGEVIAADPDSNFTAGDRVVCGTRTGSFADVATCSEAATRRVPTGMEFATAASIGTAYLTAYVSLVRLAQVQPGEWVLVHGATGGVGLATVDLAVTLGARVIATSRSADKLAVVARDYVPAAILPATGFREAVKAITGGGADVIVDPVGGDVFDESVRAIAFGGRLMVVGFAAGRIATIPANLPLIKGFSVVGVRAGEYGRRFPTRGVENLDAIWAMAAAGKLRPRVHKRYRLTDWRAAFVAMTASDLIGKLVIEP